MPSKELIQMRQLMKSSAGADAMPKLGANVDYPKQREANDQTLAMLPTEPGVTFSPVHFYGVEAELTAPELITDESIILLIHGGAFTYGSPRTVRSYLSILVAETGMRGYSVDYRLAPEHPFPAAPDDCFTVYKALVEKYPGIKISLVGESAGGNLALVATLKAMEAGIPLPASVTVYAPVTDMTGKVDRKKYSDTDMSIPADLDKLLKEVYFPENDGNHPYISPLYGNYEGFPPLKIVVDSGEVLCEDSNLLAEIAKKAGVEVDYQIWDDTFHTFPVMAKFIPEGMQVLKETAVFIKKHLE